jgi:hypothetical protein
MPTYGVTAGCVQVWAILGSANAWAGGLGSAGGPRAKQAAGEAFNRTLLALVGNVAALVVGSMIFRRSNLTDRIQARAFTARISDPGLAQVLRSTG